MLTERKCVTEETSIKLKKKLEALHLKLNNYINATKEQHRIKNA